MSSDTDSPRQRTVAELLAAHGDTAVTGRRARRRAAEDAAGTGQAVGDAAVGAGRAQPPANGSGAHGSGTAPAPYNNGSSDTRPAPSPNTAPDRYSAPGAAGGDPYINGGVDPYGVSPGAPYANSASDTAYGAPYANGAGAPGMRADDAYGAAATRAGDTYGAPYANGGGDGPHSGPATRAGDASGAPYANGAADTANDAPSARAAGDPRGGPHANGAGTAPYVNGNGNGENYGTRPAPPNPRRSAGVPDDLANLPPYPDSDAPFVNGGAVYADTEATANRGGASWTPDRSVLREPVPRELDVPVDGPAGRTAKPWSPPTADQARARPTEEMPRLRSDRTPMLDPGLTGPIEVPRLPQADDADEGPSTAIGMAPVGAEAWHRKRTSRRASRDGGPPTEADDSIGSFDDPPAGLSDEPGRRRTSPDVGKSAGPAWAAVVAQWIAGAIGGAALWVLFRFLWRDLPVVALAAAALVTVGLVLVVRALMRNDDRRTTIFAVLVGLLLTVSPAILVLLGR